MKKIVVFVIFAALTFSLCACACSQTVDDVTETDPTGESVMPTTSVTIPVPETNIPDPSTNTPLPTDSLPEGRLLR